MSIGPIIIGVGILSIGLSLAKPFSFLLNCSSILPAGMISGQGLFFASEHLGPAVTRRAILSMLLNLMLVIFCHGLPDGTFSCVAETGLGEIKGRIIQSQKNKEFLGPGRKYLVGCSLTERYKPKAR